MKPGIAFARVWADDDLIELRIVVSRDDASFASNVYTTEAELQQLAKQLASFRDRLDGDVQEIRLGEFGPAYANGAFHARLHFEGPGTLYVSTHQQAEFSRFSSGQVAGEARLFLVSEPVLLDGFLTQWSGLASGAREEAFLECLR